MRVCVQGLWHLGSVTAACLASVGHDVIGLESDAIIISELRNGRPPVFEPGLSELLRSGIEQSKLSFCASPAQALGHVDVLWVAFDTPVDDDDQADVTFVQNHVEAALPFLPDGSVVLISSQMPVGSIRQLEDLAMNKLPHKRLHFACLPENLRLGKALDVFLRPDRVVVGVRNQYSREVIERLMYPITTELEWMSVESAEMTKHAINAFLATSVVFANEIASLSELIGADAREVERGLKTESRIGPGAYLSPGGPFAGGTLARDVSFLNLLSHSQNLRTPLLSAVQPSNDEHKNWFRRKLKIRFGELGGVKVGIWGLTYKAGTDTLRRSLAVELCDWLIAEGAQVAVYDPAVKNLPPHWADKVIRFVAPLELVTDIGALIVGTEWPEFRAVASELRGRANPNMFVIDANRYLYGYLPEDAFSYISVGTRANVGP